MMADAKPKALPVLLANIPPELTERRQWVAWRYMHRPGQKKPWTKPPIDVKSGKSAKSTDPQTWDTFELASIHYSESSRGYDGIGFALCKDDPFVALDLDGCRDPGTEEVQPWVREIIDALDSYTEVSPSGTGVHILVRGRLPGQRCRKGAFEIYERDRYVTATGHRLPGTPARVAERQEQINRIHATIFQEEPRTRNGHHERAPVNDADAELVERAKQARNGEKFSALWAGDTSRYDGDESRADLALCSMLAFWTAGDPERIDALFRQSGLYRDKWEREDYRQRTIAEALKGAGEFYGSKRRRGLNGTVNVSFSQGGGTTSDGNRALRAYDIILDFFHERYQPLHRKGTSIYSGSEQDYVKAAQARDGAPIILIDRLEDAVDAPRTEGGVSRSRLPGLFKLWAPSAWQDMLASLPIEEDAPEIPDARADLFRKHVRILLSSHVTFGGIYGKDGEEKEHERRPLLQWASWFAKPGPWQDVRGYYIWSKRDAQDQVQVAIRVELAHQVHQSNLFGDISQNKFGRLCQMYDVGVTKYRDDTPVKVAGERAVLLLPAFLATAGDLPKKTLARAHAREENGKTPEVRSNA
jgi:hypothetical protein